MQGSQGDERKVKNMRPSLLVLSSVLMLTPITSPALAKRAEATTSEKQTSAQRAAAAKKAEAAKSAGSAAKASKSEAKSAKHDAKTSKSTPSAGKSSKSTASAATPEKKSTLAKQTRSRKPCYAKPVQLVRVRGQQVEPRELSLTMCNGTPNRAALDALSVLARPRDVEKPSVKALRAYAAMPMRKAKGKLTKSEKKKKYRDPLFVSERVMRVHPGLLSRLQKLADHYPGKIIEIVSGYRPDARDSSRHHHGRALDLRVAGVSRENLRDYVRTFDETGCGYYPNSFFVHMDVRDEKGYWVDRSGPGEPADYGPWPPPKQQDVDKLRDEILRAAFAEIAKIGKPGEQAQPAGAARSAEAEKPVLTEREIATARRDEAKQPARADKPVAVATRDEAAKPKTIERSVMVARTMPKMREPENEADDMTSEEVARVREEARRAIEQM